LARLDLLTPGEICTNEECWAEGRLLQHPDDDADVQTVLDQIRVHDLAAGFTEAIRASIDYVLDGARTSRFDLLSPKVHPGERASVGAKLEYEVQRVFGWKKAKPLDILLGGVPVDLKATVGDNWAIPSEAHCRLCLCTQIQLKNQRHRTWLVRAHTAWLYRGKGNKDGKRGLAVQAREEWAVPLYDWAPLPVNPLVNLSEDQADEVLADKPGQQARLRMMFSYLPDTVIPRSVITTVCAGNEDPLRRVRAIRERMQKEQGLLLLCGKWPLERKLAARYGFDLGNSSWVAVSPAKRAELGDSTTDGETLWEAEDDAGS